MIARPTAPPPSASRLAAHRDPRRQQAEADLDDVLRRFGENFVPLAVARVGHELAEGLYPETTGIAGWIGRLDAYSLEADGEDYLKRRRAEREAREAAAPVDLTGACNALREAQEEVDVAHRLLTTAWLDAEAEADGAAGSIAAFRIHIRAAFETLKAIEEQVSDALSDIRKATPRREERSGPPLGSAPAGDCTVAPDNPS